MTRHRSTIKSAGGGKAIGVVVAPQDSAPSFKDKGSLPQSKLGGGGGPV